MPSVTWGVMKGCSGGKRIQPRYVQMDSENTGCIGKRQLKSMKFQKSANST
ncbi:hypothetical protein TNCV_2673761, partial [Trichonephila clavipes]